MQSVYMCVNSNTDKCVLIYENNQNPLDNTQTQRSATFNRILYVLYQETRDATAWKCTVAMVTCIQINHVHWCGAVFKLFTVTGEVSWYTISKATRSETGVLRDKSIKWFCKATKHPEISQQTRTNFIWKDNQEDEDCQIWLSVPKGGVLTAAAERPEAGLGSVTAGCKELSGSQRHMQPRRYTVINKGWRAKLCGGDTVN